MASRILAALLGILLVTASWSAAFAQAAQANPPGQAAAQVPADQARPPDAEKKETRPAEEQAPRWAFKLNAGFYGADPFARPVGNIDNAFQTPYPTLSNTGTEQPKLNARVDYDFADGRSKLTFDGGYAGTSGIIHTGVGPFQIEQGTNTSYAKGAYTRNAFRAQFFTNLLDGTAPALLAIGTDGKPIQFAFNTKTFGVDVSNISTIGARHVLSYGGNLRYNTFDLSIAPLGSSRSEQGVYVQDEMFLGEKVRWQVGLRMDHFDVLDDVVFSPHDADVRAG